MPRAQIDMLRTARRRLDALMVTGKTGEAVRRTGEIIDGDLAAIEGYLARLTGCLDRAAPALRAVVDETSSGLPAPVAACLDESLDEGRRLREQLGRSRDQLGMMAVDVARLERTLDANQRGLLAELDRLQQVGEAVQSERILALIFSFGLSELFGGRERDEAARSIMSAIAGTGQQLRMVRAASVEVQQFAALARGLSGQVGLVAVSVDQIRASARQVDDFADGAEGPPAAIRRALARAALSQIDDLRMVLDAGR